MIRTKMQAWSVSPWLRGSSLVEHFSVTAEGGRQRLIPHDALKMTRLAASTQTQCLSERINLDREEDCLSVANPSLVSCLILSSLVSEADIWITYDQMFNTVESIPAKELTHCQTTPQTPPFYQLLCWLSHLQLLSDFFFSWENWSRRRYILFSEKMSVFN